MKNNKIMRAIIALMLLVAICIPVTAFAASPNYAFSFEFSNLNDQTTDSYQKGDTEQNWYVSLYNNGTNTMSSSNILGLRMNRNGSFISGYHTFSNYVTSYQLPYYDDVTVKSTDWVYMGAKKDSTSTSTADLVISGKFNP